MIDDGGRVDGTATESATRRFGRADLSEGLIADFLAVVIRQSVKITGCVWRRDALPLGELSPGVAPHLDVWLSYLLARDGAAAYYSPQRLMSYRLHRGPTARRGIPPCGWRGSSAGNGCCATRAWTCMPACSCGESPAITASPPRACCGGHAPPCPSAPGGRDAPLPDAARGCGLGRVMGCAAVVARSAVMSVSGGAELAATPRLMSSADRPLELLRGLSHSAIRQSRPGRDVGERARAVAQVEHPQQRASSSGGSRRRRLLGTARAGPSCGSPCGLRLTHVRSVSSTSRIARQRRTDSPRTAGPIRCRARPPTCGSPDRPPCAVRESGRRAGGRSQASRIAARRRPTARSRPPDVRRRARAARSRRRGRSRRRRGGCACT